MITNKEIQALQPRETSYRVNCGGGIGLYVVVAKNSKNFQFRYRRLADGKQTFIGLGSFTKGDITLAEAREKANDFRKMLKNGTDPKVAKKKEKLEVKSTHENTLDAVFEQFLVLKRSEVTERTAKLIVSTYNNHLKKPLGSIPITDISAPIAIAALKPLERQEKLAALRACCIHLNAIANFAVNAGMIPFNPMLNITKTFKKPKTKNFAALKPEEIGKLVEFLSDDENGTFLSINLAKFQLLTMVRPNEATKAEWSEIDFDNKLWTIPAEKMKGRIEHVVPLNDQAIEVLKAMMLVNGKRKWVFASLKKPKTHVTNITVSRLLSVNGLATAHGLRSLASSTLHAEGFDSMIIESCLAHKDSNIVRATYNRRDNQKFIDRRRRLMDWWGNYVENGGQPTQPEQSNVVNFN